MGHLDYFDLYHSYGTVQAPTKWVSITVMSHHQIWIKHLCRRKWTWAWAWWSGSWSSPFKEECCWGLGHCLILFGQSVKLSSAVPSHAPHRKQWFLSFLNLSCAKSIPLIHNISLWCDMFCQTLRYLFWCDVHLNQRFQPSTVFAGYRKSVLGSSVTWYRYCDAEAFAGLRLEGWWDVHYKVVV